MDKDRIAGSAKDFAGKVESTIGDMAGDAKTQASGRAREAAGAVQNLYGQAKDAAREATDTAASYAKDAYEASGDTFRDSSQAVAKKVQDNPLGALLVAGGIGFAVAAPTGGRPHCQIRTSSQAVGSTIERDEASSASPVRRERQPFHPVKPKPPAFRL